MKSEKQNILSLQQKIKILNTKKDSYPKLNEYNKNLTEQNIELNNKFYLLLYSYMNNFYLNSSLRKQKS